MNKHAAIFIMLALPFASFAQQQDTTKHHKYHKFSIGVQVNTLSSIYMAPEDYYLSTITPEASAIPNYNGNGKTVNPATPQDYQQGTSSDKSYSLGLIAKYRIGKDWMVRLRVVMSQFSTSTTYSFYNIIPLNTVQTSNQGGSYSRNDWMFSPGVEREINMRHFNFYAGVEVPVTIYGTATSSSYNYVYQQDTLHNSDFYNYTFHNGWSAGLGFYSGLSYRYKMISIGPEISFGYIYYYVGGNYQYTFQTTNGSKPQTPDITNYTGYFFSKWLLSPIIGSINLSIRL